ncbi:hypothetical protein EKK58_10210 [Candidatus Dependentiae bacterium]|nr:MAG: hypothetical protein EKK58_10210 [Candidatus Dependentiae bacterium]
MSKHTPTPWKIEIINKWPFGLSIKNESETIVNFNAIAFSSQQKSYQDYKKAVGFSKLEKETIIPLINKNEANVEHIVHCVNVHDELVEALENIYNIHLNTIPENEKQYKIISEAKKVLSKAKAK